MNEITNIPRALQSIQPCQVAMGRIEMTCNCDDIWLQDWLPMPNTSCFDNTIVLCRVEDNVRTIIVTSHFDSSHSNPTWLYKL
jgi:hypothetical protein